MSVEGKGIPEVVRSRIIFTAFCQTLVEFLFSNFKNFI